jgi:uncharacterized membrane protein YdbT with pleckstrin-like domain
VIGAAILLPFIGWVLAAIELPFLIWFATRIGKLRSKSHISVYRDRLEVTHTFLRKMQVRIEASKLETVSFNESVLGGNRYGSVHVTGSGGTKLLLQPVVDAENLAEAIRKIASAPAQKKSAPSETLQAMPGDLKLCPFCAEEVKAQAKKCKHCGSEIE